MKNGGKDLAAPAARGTDCHTSDFGHWFAMTGAGRFADVVGRLIEGEIRTKDA